MRLGYNWKWGPFELIDRIGPAWFRDRLEAEGVEVPPLLAQVGDGSFYRVEDGRLQHLTRRRRLCRRRAPEGVLLLEDVKRAQQAGREERLGQSLWDIGDGVACLEFHSKMNAIDPDTLDLVDKAIGIVAKDFKALVDLQRGRELLGRRQYRPRAVRRQRRASGR